MVTRILALLVGFVCHISFFVAVGLMFQGLYGGMSVAIGTLHGWLAVVGDLLLVVQFPLVHSLLLSASGRTFLAKLFPGDLGRQLVSTTFVLVASLQLIVLFTLWSPLDEWQWESSGIVKEIWVVAYWSAWLFLSIAMYQAGLATQMGYMGWWAVVRGKEPSYPYLNTEGLYRICRHPVYLAMLLVAWSGPVWTWDHLCIGSVFLLYCVLGPILKERRYSRKFGLAFENYKSATPFFPTMTSLQLYLFKESTLQRGVPSPGDKV